MALLLFVNCKGKSSLHYGDAKNSNMTAGRRLKKLTSELEKGISLSKCRKCGCMKGALEEIREILSYDPGEDAATLREKVQTWLARSEDSLYT